MSFIEGLIHALGSLESDRIAIHQERCISVRNRNAGCSRCAQACTSGVLTYRENELTVDAEKCIGCGTCATACPTCAIEMREPSDEELTKYMKSVLVATNGHPVFACETALRAVEACAKAEKQAGAGLRSLGSKRAQEGPAHDPAQVCELACLGRIDESVLVGLAAYKAQSVTLVCGSCDACPHAPGGEMVRSVIESSRNLLGAFGSAMPIELVEELPRRVLAGERLAGRATPVGSSADSRRDFFKSVKRGATHAAATAVEEALLPNAGEEKQAQPVSPAYRKVNERGTLSQFVPSRRARTYNYLKHVGEPVAEHVDTRIVGCVSIDPQKCNSCRMCAVFCPTGALAKLDGDGTFGIMHRPAACVQCRLCEGICPTGALTVSSRMSVARFVGKKALRYDMKKPDWTPNTPNSMYNKVHTVLGDDLEMCMF